MTVVSAPINLTEARHRVNSALRTEPMVPRTIEAIIEERDELAERVRQLEAIIADDDWVPASWSLSPALVAILNVLSVREVASRRALWTALYGDAPDGGPGLHVINVHVFKLRRRVGPHGLVIRNHHARGYSLNSASRATVERLKAAKEQARG